MPAITETARRFFTACETGRGWEACRAYCTEDATFSAQCEPLAEIGTVAAYTDWISGVLHAFRDGWYEVRSFATDEVTGTVCAYGVFSARIVGKAAPDKVIHADYVYVMRFDGPAIRHLTKIWNAGWTMKEMGWV